MHLGLLLLFLLIGLAMKKGEGGNVRGRSGNSEKLNISSNQMQNILKKEKNVLDILKSCFFIWGNFYLLKRKCYVMEKVIT
mmetsp:Transcript_21230/g.21543  ORF Transcript_21230/g.21543 Transcript_21230/m.21543 type:complete len:81 (+) Transcript_21230:205-447(+)